MSSHHEGFFWDGYLHWAQVLETVSPDWRSPHGNRRPPDDLVLYEPLFVRVSFSLTGNNRERYEERAEAFLSDIGSIEDQKQIENFQNEFLEEFQQDFSFLNHYIYDPVDFLIGVLHTIRCRVPLEFFVYRKVPKTKQEHSTTTRGFKIIDIGAPTLAEKTDVQVADWVEPPNAAAPSKIGAIIDNDIGYLNRRFSRDTDDGPVSRFFALWLQSRERIPSTEVPGGTKFVHIGRVLSLAEITRMMQNTHYGEESIYQHVNKNLHLAERNKMHPPRDTHGTAVADLAFGEAPDGKASITGIPLLGVQLPPVAAEDTSGTHSESYIVQGFRRLCLEAVRINRRAHLIVNISYGAVAGQKNGGKFIEAQIAREIEMMSRWGLTVEVVYAFGNSRNSRQIAELKVPKCDCSDTLVWTIHPDNPVPAIMEVRVKEWQDGESRLTGDPSDITVILKPPGIDTRITVKPIADNAEPKLAPDQDASDWRVYHVPQRVVGNWNDKRKVNPASYQVALAPTRWLSEDIPRASAGDWEILFKNESEQDVNLVLQIQRGDTAPWLQHGGRQTHFAGNFVSVDVGGYPDQDVKPPLTNAGTQSSYTTATNADGLIHTAGACESIFDIRRPATYSSNGADWTNVKSPSDTRVVDKMFTKGLLTTGTYTGSTSRLSGTSAAAALVSRNLVTVTVPDPSDTCDPS